MSFFTEPPEWFKRYFWQVAAALLFMTAGALSGYFVARLGQPAPVVPVPVPPPLAAEAQPGAFGWVAPDEQQLQENLDPAKTQQFKDTPAGKAAMGDGDAFLYRAVLECNGGKYPNVNQQSVGCCVGCGNKHGIDVCQAVQIKLMNRAESFRPVSVEVIYGLSRVDIGGGRIRGDGSVGAWAKAAVEKFGVVAMAKYPSADLTVFSPARARQFGSQGVPADIKAATTEHPVKGCALVRSWTDVQRAVLQGYPVAVCSNVGFEDPNGTPGTRDAEGFCRPRGMWPHCMCVVAVRGGVRPGGFILNSWGDGAHHGPVWPADAPVAGFWADAAVIDRMAQQGDSFALADLAGFAARRLDWFTVKPRNGLRDRETLFALAP